jgi:hypothetical protein
MIGHIVSFGLVHPDASDADKHDRAPDGACGN